MSAQTFEIEFLGQKLTLKTGSDPETVQEAVELARDRIQDAQRRTKGAAPHQIALIALLDLSEEYIRARRRTQEYKSEITRRSSALVNELTQTFEEK